MLIEETDFNDARALRVKAERLLKEKKANIGKPLVEYDMKKLLHELQVHQIELEMQNEELQMAYDAAEAALKKYTLLYDLAPMGYLTLGIDGSIRELNFTTAEILGERRFKLENRNFKTFVSQESKPIFNAFFSLVFTSRTKQACQVSLEIDNQQLCEVYMEAIVTGDEPLCLLSIVDISKFRQ